MLRNLAVRSIVLMLAYCALGMIACSRDAVEQVERLRSRYSASLGGFVVRDDPTSGRQEVVVDVLLSWHGQEALPGVTLDLSMVDARGELKASRKLWAETQGMVKGSSHQLEFTLSDLDYVEGDGFHVEVRSPVPAALRVEYREFEGTGR